MNTNFKNLISLFLIVACAFSVSCSKLNKQFGHFPNTNNNKYSTIFINNVMYNNIQINNVNQNFIVEIKYPYDDHMNWNIVAMPEAVSCTNCYYGMTGDTKFLKNEEGYLGFSDGKTVFEFSLNTQLLKLNGSKKYSVIIVQRPMFAKNLHEYFRILVIDINY